MVPRPIHNEAIVSRAPAITVHINMTQMVAKSFRFSQILRVGKVQLQPADLAPVGHAHSTVVVVLGHSDLAGAASTMAIRLVAIVIGRGGVTVLVYKVVACIGILQSELSAHHMCMCR